MLIIPTDVDKPMVLVSFYIQSVILPPDGEPVLVDEIWQVGAIGREYSDRLGSSQVKIAEAVAHLLDKMGLAKTQIGCMGGHTYTRTRDQFDQVTMTPEQWLANGE